MTTRTRLVDRILAAVGLVGTAPVLALAAVGIKLSDPGQVLYRTQRSGIFARPFTMYKFRTMRSSGPGETEGRITGGRDARVFAWGRLLRRLKIDELPQLLNVVLGDMAIVGPRPEDPTIVEREYAAWMRETLEVLPGLTSPGSLDYYAEEAALPDDPFEAERIYLEELLPRKLAVDLVYVRNRSVAYDVVLIVRTIASVLGLHSLFERARTAESAQAQRILREVAT